MAERKTKRVRHGKGEYILIGPSGRIELCTLWGTTMYLRKRLLLLAPVKILRDRAR